jgi:hypothetical protein
VVGVTPHDLVRARFPQLDEGYESFYLRAADPSGDLGVWIRYTVHRAPGQAPTGSLWFTLFDAAAGVPTAAKTTTTSLQSGGDAWISIGEAAIGPGAANGRIAVPGGVQVSWELTFSGSATYPHLPRAWMYDAPLPRTKPVSLHPSASFEGSLEVGGRTVVLDGWRGMVGHNWGSQHAERWIWLHGTGFDGVADSWLDVVLARLRLGRWTTPWSGFGAVSIGGHRHEVGGLARVRSTSVEEHPDRLTFSLPGRGLRAHGTVGAPRDRFVGWVYADPDGSSHDVAHCSIADLDFTLEQDGRPPLRLHAGGTAAYELGMREHDHGIEIQPFPDG